MDANVLIKGALPAVIVGCVLYLAGAVIGPMIGPGWSDVIEGLAFFVGLAWAAVGIRRRNREVAAQKPS